MKLTWKENKIKNVESNSHRKIKKYFKDLINLIIIALLLLGVVSTNKQKSVAKVIEVSEKDDKLEIPPMILIKSDGGILYSTTELATIYDRMKSYKPDEIWYIVDKRQELHLRLVMGE